jgi:hypothetical protein
MNATNSKKDIFPRAEDLFAPWADRFITHLKANATRWNIPVSQAMAGERRFSNTLAVHTVYELDALFVDYNNKYHIANVKDTRTSVAVAAKDVAQRIFKEALRNFLKEYILYNSLVTEPDLINLGLTPHKTTHRPAKRAKTFPVAQKVESTAPCVLDLHVIDSHGKTPDMTRSVGCCYAILPHYPKSLDELSRRTSSNTSVITLRFDLSERGKTVYFAFCWENTRGQDGDWGNISSGIIG